MPVNEFANLMPKKEHNRLGEKGRVNHALQSSGRIDLLRSRVAGFFSGFGVSGWKVVGLAFFVGFLIRLVPEVLSYPHAIGFDTVYYAWRINSGVILYNWSELFSTTWLLYGILVPIYSLVHGDPFMLLKAVAPLLFGFNALGVFFFAKKALNWTDKKALFCSLVFSLQIAALTISWGLYRNLLGMAVLLFALPFLKDVGKSWKAFLLFALLSVLVVFSHEYAEVTLFVAAFAVAASAFLKKAIKQSLKVIGAVTPALGLFLVRIFLVLFPVSYSVPGLNYISTIQPVGHYTGVFFFFTNYLRVSDNFQYYPSYLALFANVASLFALLFIFLLPLVLVGFFRNAILDGWTALLLVGSLGALIVPWFALDEWGRWMLMLVYPLTFYVVNGVGRVVHGGGVSVSPRWRRLNWLKVSKRAVTGLLIVSFGLASVFMACPLVNGQFGLVGLPTTVGYVPSSMQSNTLPLIDVDSAVNALEWVNTQMNGSTAFLAQKAFLWWSMMYLSDTRGIVYFDGNFDTAISAAHTHGFSTVYFVWWNANIGWYGITVPSYFVSLKDFGRISVYDYVGENGGS
jgi:hypothetical protein